MRALLAVLAAAAAAPSAASALSCARPADTAARADYALLGQVMQVNLVRTYPRKPFSGRQPLMLQEFSAEVGAVQRLRGTSAPPTVVYLFRSKRITCDLARPVGPGEHVVLTVTRDAPGRPDFVLAFTPEEYARLARSERAQP